MTTTESISKLRQMQSQIVHGSNVFGDIADCIAALEAENIRRIRHLNRLASWAQQDPTGPIHAGGIQAWVLNEIRGALGQPTQLTYWEPDGLKRPNDPSSATAGA